LEKLLHIAAAMEESLQLEYDFQYFSPLGIKFFQLKPCARPDTF